MAPKKKKENILTPSMLGFLVGLGTWIVIFVVIGIMYFMVNNSIPFLEKMLAIPIKYFMRGFWDALGIESANEITRPIEIGVYMGAALLWGFIGSLIGYLVQRFSRFYKEK